MIKYHHLLPKEINQEQTATTVTIVVFVNIIIGIKSLLLAVNHASCRLIGCSV